ncbi:hypothetical protein KR018_005301, partial [Drosophila ironensis]
LWLAVVSVSSETMIEVDENGDEYELKKFYIQGRQLKGDGSQSQCVVTRRKRASRALTTFGQASQTNGSISVTSQPLKLEHREAAAPIAADAANAPQKHRYVALTGVHVEPGVPHDDDDNEDDDDDEEEDEDFEDHNAPKSEASFVPAALALPLAPQSSQSHLNQGVSVVANAASHANVAEDAGIVVVQSHQPPKVNPDTHAVFELKPVQADVAPGYPFLHPWEVVDHYGGEGDGDYDEEDYDEEDYDDFYYGNGGDYYRGQSGYHPLGDYDEELIEEVNPVSTTAVWSTGDDDGDIHPVINSPNQKNKNKKKKQKQKQKQKQNQKNKNQKNRNQKQKQKNKQRGQPEEQSNKKPNQQMDQKKKPEKNPGQKDQKKKQEKEQQEEQSLEELKPVAVVMKPETGAEVSASASSSSSQSNSSSQTNSSDKKKPKKKKKPSSSSSSSSNGSSSSSTSVQRKKKKQGSSGSSSSSSSVSNSNKRRRPSSSSSGSSGSSSNIGGYRRRRPQQQQQKQQNMQRQQQQQRRRRQQQQQKRRRQQQQQRRRRKQQQQRRRRFRNKNRQFYGDEPIINCIYINKDPPTTTTTTARPFWNILGRQSSDQATPPDAAGKDNSEGDVDAAAQQAVLQAVRRNFNEFGGRKRTNLRFVS